MGKTLRKLVEFAEHNGWTVDASGNAVRFLKPDGETMIVCHKTESDHRAEKNTIARLRRAGLKVPR